MNEPFYIGYLPTAPAGLRRWLRAVVIGVGALAFVVALLMATGFQPLPQSLFEFGQAREYTGLLRAQPYPALLVNHAGKLEQYLLVGVGKHAAEVGGFAGQTVRLRGALITRDGLRMLELVSGSIMAANAARPPELRDEPLGQFTLVGEIIDSKCYLGVMNPGNTKPHRECAVRCISGGVPPMLLARDTQGQELALQLADAAGQPMRQQILDYVAEPVEITGQVWRTGEWLTLRADLTAYRRR